jgi:hypothetical protein
MTPSTSPVASGPLSPRLKEHGISEDRLKDRLSGKS